MRDFRSAARRPTTTVRLGSPDGARTSTVDVRRLAVPAVARQIVLDQEAVEPLVVDEPQSSPRTIPLASRCASAVGEPQLDQLVGDDLHDDPPPERVETVASSSGSSLSNHSSD